MTLLETRQLGIEFERRVQTMIPDREYDKLDTETIYSFLNQFQDKYIHDIFRNLDNIQSGTKLSAHVESILQSLLRDDEILVTADGVIENTSSIVDSNGVVISDTGRSITYPLSKQFYMYVRSVSKVNNTFSFKGQDNNSSIRILPNDLVSQNDVWKLIETPHNSLRILRHPAAVLSKYNATGKPTLTVIYDQYTNPLGIKVLYYAQPAHFDLMTSTPCELPMDAFEELVSGAVDLYVDYVAGAEAKKRQKQEAAQKRAREDQRDARRSGGNQDEQS